MEPLLINSSEISSMVGKFYWPLTRVAGVLAIAPVIGGPQVPVRIRAGLAVLITLLILPSIGTVPDIEPLSAEGVLLTVQQLLIGVSMGFVLQLVFTAVTLAGENIAMTMGLGFAVMSDPQNGVTVPVVSHFFMIMTTLLFLALNGHHALLQLLVQSFDSFPVFADKSSKESLVERFWQLLLWSKVIFRGALYVALPAVAALLTVNMVMGVMTRAAPQLNIFSVGFPITMVVGFIVIMVTLPGLVPILEKLLAEAFTVIAQLIGD